MAEVVGGVMPPMPLDFGSPNVLTLATTWPSLLIFVSLGTVVKFLMSYNTLDALQDQAISLLTAPEEDAFDFIVGSGSAGSVVANRLSENGKFSVLLLEAGGNPNPIQHIPGLCLFLLNRPYIDWQYKTTTQKNGCGAMKNKQCNWARGKGLGGSSLLNFLVYLRGNPLDFDNWAKITGDVRWSYEEVLKFFKKSESYSGKFFDELYHSKTGLLKVSQAPFYPLDGLGEILVKAGKELGFPTCDLNGRWTEGFSPVFSTQHNGLRWSTKRAFLDSATERSNLVVRKFAHASKILFRGLDNEAYGVEYWRHGVQRTAYALKEVILSAGAINSPQLLMLSGVGPRDDLFKKGILPLHLVDLPVGFNLQDHINTGVGPFLINKTISTISDRDINAEAIAQFAQSGNGVLSTSPISSAGFIVSSTAKLRNESTWADIQFMMFPYGIHSTVIEDYVTTFNMREDVTAQYFAPLQGKDSFQILTSLARPKSRGRVELASSDPFEPPIINPKYFDREEDLDTLLDGIKNALRLVETTRAFQEINATLTHTSFPGCEGHKFRSDDYWKCFMKSYSLTIFHPTGTCAMGSSESTEAVVDSELRVLKTRNLRVIDASVMPTIPVANLNAPTIMVAERGSQFILDHWQGLEEKKISKFFLHHMN